MAKKGQVFKKYSPEFKLSVILDMRENKLSYHETIRKYFSHLASPKNFAFLLNWERKYLEEGYERKEAMKMVAKQKGMSKSEVYKELL